METNQKVLIFHYKQTDTHFIIIYTSPLFSIRSETCTSQNQSKWKARHRRWDRLTTPWEKYFLNLTNCCASKSYDCSAGQLFLLLHSKILSELFLNMMFLFRAGFRISLQPIIDEIQFHNYFQYIPNPMGPNCPL